MFWNFFKTFFTTFLLFSKCHQVTFGRLRWQTWFERRDDINPRNATALPQVIVTSPQTLCSAAVSRSINSITWKPVLKILSIPMLWSCWRTYNFLIKNVGEYSCGTNPWIVLLQQNPDQKEYSTNVKEFSYSIYIHRNFTEQN